MNELIENPEVLGFFFPAHRVLPFILITTPWFSFGELPLTDLPSIWFRCWSHSPTPLVTQAWPISVIHAPDYCILAQGWMGTWPMSLQWDIVSIFFFLLTRKRHLPLKFQREYDISLGSWKPSCSPGSSLPKYSALKTAELRDGEKVNHSSRYCAKFRDTTENKSGF